MIFDKLFSPKHQHKDPAKRISAVDEIIDVTLAHKGWLHDLAFNDENCDVKLAALSKLNDFTLWLKAFEENNYEGIKKRALQEVLERLEKPEQVSDKLFQEILLNKRYTEISKKLKASSKRLTANEDWIFAWLLQSSDDAGLQRFYAESDHHEHCKHVIEYFKDNEKVLKKLRKKTTIPELNHLIDANLDALKQKAEKPIQIMKSGKLINARLNALLDNDDYDVVTNNKKILHGEFQDLKKEFIYLDQNSASELTQKYLFLKERVEKRLSDLLPAHEEKLAFQLLNEQQNALAAQVESIQEQVEHLFDVEDKTDFNIQHELLSNAMSDAKEQYTSLIDRISDSTQPPLMVQQKQIKRTINTIDEMLGNAADIVANNQVLASTISSLEKLQSAFEGNQITLNELKLQFASEKNNIKREDAYSPKLLSSYKAVSKKVQAHLDAFKAEQKKYSQRCQGKLRTVSTLISSGKYKAALNVFKTAEKLLKNVSSPDRQLTKKFQDVSKEIEKIADLQSFIAAPKKPEMILQAKDIADDSSLTIKQRAGAIKKLRADWNTLGRLDTEEDNNINSEFDRILEQAFEPCRAHYAQMEQAREKNAEKLADLLAELEQLQSVEMSDSDFVEKYNELTTSFFAIKSVDHERRKEFKEQFTKLTQPLKKRIAEIYEARVFKKNSLIKKAKKYFEEDDVKAAANNAKQLQSDWKLIGFAGKGQDKELWTEFREVNDQIFEKLANMRANQKEESQSLIDQRKESLARLIQPDDLKSANASELASIRQALEALTIQKDEVDNKQSREFNGQLTQALRNVESLAYDKVKTEKSKQMEALINNLLNEGDVETKSLPGIIKLGLEQNVGSHEVLDAFSKQQLFTSIFLLLDEKESTDDSATRLALMAAKLEGKVSLSARLSFAHWMGRGVLNDSDIVLLNEHKAKLIQYADRIL